MKQKKIPGILLAIFCLPLCGGRTTPANADNDSYYGGAQPISFYSIYYRRTVTVNDFFNFLDKIGLSLIYLNETVQLSVIMKSHNTYFRGFRNATPEKVI